MYVFPDAVVRCFWMQERCTFGTSNLLIVYNLHMIDTLVFSDAGEVYI